MSHCFKPQGQDLDCCLRYGFRRVDRSRHALRTNNAEGRFPARRPSSFVGHAGQSCWTLNGGAPRPDRSRACHTRFSAQARSRPGSAWRGAGFASGSTSALLRQLRLALLCSRRTGALARLLGAFPALEPRRRFERLFDAQITPENVAARDAPISNGPASRGFERPYGWAWLLKLCGELGRFGAAGWFRSADASGRPDPRSADRASYLSRHYPVRVGTHFNTAFAPAARRRLCGRDRRWGTSGLRFARQGIWRGTAATGTARPGSPAATSSFLPP